MRNLLLLGAAVLAVVACQKPANELDVDTDLPLETGAGNLPQVGSVTPSLQGMLLDDNPDVAGVQATVMVRFRDFMDPGSVTSNVSVLNTTTNLLVSGLDVSYNADARTLYVRHENWAQSSAYLLTIGTGGARNRWGKPLDGNGNRTEEGTPYDDFLTTFYTSGSNPDSCVATVPPRINTFDPDTEAIDDTMPDITVSFTTGMDTTTLVPANFLLTDGTGSSVPLERVWVTETAVSFKPRAGSPLLWGKTYSMTVTSGAVLAKALPRTPGHVLSLDGDGDGAEENEPNYQSYFLCDTLDAPEADVTPATNGLFFDFNDDMDETTLTPENVRAFDAEGYVPGTFVFLRVNGDTRIGYYFSRPVSGTLRAFVAREVRAKNGRQLDSNNNGIGGEPWDDYWWP
jgi:hypothetical protein